MKIIHLLSFVIITFLFSYVMPACTYKKGNGDITTETRKTGSFNGISVSGDFDVEIKTGDREEVTIEADDNLIHNIETEVVQGTLRIRSKDHNLRNAHFKAFITAKKIDNISASASANIEVKDIILSNNSVQLKASSAGEITARVNAPEVNTEGSSGSTVTLSGKTRNFKGTTSSGSEINAMDLLSENSIVSSSSGAKIKVHSSISLDATASSGASITYRGGGNVKESVSSGGKVEKLD